MANLNTPNSAATDMYQLDPLGVIRRKFWSILFFVICAIALSLLYFSKAPKTYESWARVYIDDHRAPTFSVDGEAVESSSVEKYLEIISSRAVLAEAIDNCDIDQMQSLAEADDALMFVRENFVATPSDTKSASGVMRLRFKSGVAEDCQPILTNILTAFNSFIKQGSEDTGSGMVDTMSKLEDERTQRFAEVMKGIDELMQKPFIQVTEGKVYNQYEGQASKLQIELDENSSERLRFESLRENLYRAQANGENIEDLVVNTIQDMNEGQLGGYTTTHHKYLDLKVREKEMMGEFGNDHPQLTNVRQQILMVDAMRKEQLLSALRSNTEVSENADFFTVVTNYISNKIRFFDSHEAQLSEAIRSSKMKSLEITKDCEKLTMLLAEREMMANSSFEMQDKVQEYNVLSRFQFQDVRVIDPASTAEQVAPDLAICLAAGTLLGGLAGFVFGAFKEMAEKTFRSTEDVSSQLGVDVVAQVAEFDTRARDNKAYKDFDGDLVTVHRPQSQPAESFKAFRTSIFFKSKQQPNLKTIQITSPTPGDGKSTVAANLAVVMAQSGRKVLLIDCDLRRQTQHIRFGIGNHVGVTSVISGEAHLEQAIQETALKNLSILTSGPSCANPAEILTTEDFSTFMSDVRRLFDFVIIDTPPVLPVTDPVIISNYVDALYMPIRIRSGVQVKSQKAIEAMTLVGQDVDGIIINGLTRKEAGSYSYGGYGYKTYGAYGAYNKSKDLQTSSEMKLRNSPLADAANKESSKSNESLKPPHSSTFKRELS
jgi:capsular exopolysaccharide synthesis family protein